MPRLYIGTSGWSYDHWRDCFYPGVPRKDWLKCYARYLSAVEINASFYRLQTPKAMQNWFNQTPTDFRFALKANRYLTHNKKLPDYPRPSATLEERDSPMNALN